MEVDVTIPLKSGMFLPRPGLPDLWIGLKYEKLSDLCYKCAIFGHAKKDCGHPKMLLSNQYGIKIPTFGDWLRTKYEKQPPEIYEKTFSSWECPPEDGSTEDIPKSVLAVQAMQDDNQVSDGGPKPIRDKDDGAISDTNSHGEVPLQYQSLAIEDVDTTKQKLTGMPRPHGEVLFLAQLMAKSLQ